MEAIWKEVLGSELLTVPRLSRIYFQGKLYKYPLDLWNTMQNLGIIDSSLILLSYLKWRVFPYPEEESFEQWVTNRFGRQLYKWFFKTYTEKVWGIPCSTIRADWAAQRIKGLSLKTVITQALGVNNNTRSLIDEFYYPRLGPGMMWEAIQRIVQDSGTTLALNCEVVALERENHNRIKQVIVRDKDGERALSGDQFISSMAASDLVKFLRPQAPDHVLEAANGLRYRDFLIVVLIVEQENVFPDNWIYIHSPDFFVGRIQNFKNWSSDMVPNNNYTALGMEYFSNEGDALWETDDEELIALASSELIRMDFIETGMIQDGIVIRQKKAYPVYDHAYRRHLNIIQAYANSFENLQTIGRNGMHRYNNQDHSMLTGLLAVRNLFGEQNDLWEINTERSYHEAFLTEEEHDNALSSNTDSNDNPAIMRPRPAEQDNTTP